MKTIVRLLLLALATAAGVLLSNETLQASALVVTNPGFVATINSNFTYNSVNYLQGQDLPAGLYVNTLDANSTGNVRKQSDDLQVAPGATATVTGWHPTGLPPTAGPRAGVANFGSGDVANLVATGPAPADGLNVGFSQTLPGNIQLLSRYTYTLSMTLNSLTLNIPTNFFADLTVGGVPVGGTLTYLPPPNDSTPGSATVRYYAGNTPLVGNLGLIIEATFQTTGTSDIRRILVDNVTLDATIPEPSTILLLLVGAGWLGRRLWRAEPRL